MISRWEATTRLRRTTGCAAPDAGAPTLIGVDDLTTPWWAKVGETMAGSGTGRMLRAAPVALGVLGVLGVLERLAWQTSPRLTLLAAAVQLVSGCATAFGLLDGAVAEAGLLSDLVQRHAGHAELVTADLLLGDFGLVRREVRA